MVVKVSLKSTPGACWNPLATNRILNLVTLPWVSFFSLVTGLVVMGSFLALDRLIKWKVLVVNSCCIFLKYAANYWSFRGYFRICLKDLGSEFLVSLEGL